MIRELTLKNFAAFRELSIVFSPRVNVIIGENSCGKTQLLKAAYVLSVLGSELGSDNKPSKEKVQRLLTDKLLKTFKPAGNKLGKLYNRGGDGKAEINALFFEGCELGANFTSRARKSQVSGNYKEPFDQGSVYIPTKEVLSFLDGISNTSSDNETLNRLFDTTYFDLTEKLLNQQQVGIEEKTVWFREDITNELGGKFLFDGPEVIFREGKYKKYKRKHASKSYFSPSSKHGLSTAMTAEGYRKIGVLQRLLENQAIGTGTNGPLIWDEPESNMNPTLVYLLVLALIKLSRNHQQIILATHDYVLLKWFDLLMDIQGEGDHILYHALYRDEAGQLRKESSNNYTELSNNAISSTFSSLYDAEIERSFESQKG